jgi:hypothetical protein
MAMALTVEELAGIKKLLSRWEKKQKAMRFVRWIPVAMGLLVGGVGCWGLSLAYKFMTDFPQKEAANPVTHLDLYTERILTFSTCAIYTLSLFCLGMVGALLVSPLLNWIKIREKSRWVKLARSYLETLEAQTPPPSKP